MASSLNRFSNLTYDELFERHTISEIKSYQSGLEKEINKKKDEIRILVGNRYRDFIEVADKINLINDLSKNITSQIQHISSTLSTFNLNFDKYIASDNAKSTEHEKVNPKNTIAILIKLLMDIENQLWFKMNRSEFAKATSILQLSIHIKTILNLDLNPYVEQNFPVVEEIWGSILRFPSILTKTVEEKLRATDLSSTITCECLYTLTILENLSPVDLIKRFVDIRLEALKVVLNVENVKANAKHNIINSFQIIINTFEILYTCFRISDDSDPGRYWTQMQNMIAPVCEPAVTFVSFDYTAQFGKIYIPVAVQNFKVKTNKSVNAIPPSEYSQFISEWFSRVKEYVKDNLPALLNLIATFKNMLALKEAVPPLPEDWYTVMKYLQQDEDLNLWNELYQNLITERAKTILLEQWDSAFKLIHSEFENLIIHINNNTKEPENDLHCFLWNCFEEDLVEKIIPDSTNNKRSLSIKSAGLSPASGKLCIFIEHLINKMIQELAELCSPDTAESQVLKQQQQQCCLELMEKLINHIQLALGEENVTENLILFCVRFLSGISIFCSSLKNCILLIDEKAEKWLHINAKLQNESLNIWRKWYSLVSPGILSEFNSYTTIPSSSSYRIKYFPKWGTVKIRNETEDGETIETELKVPVQASFAIQRLLNSLTSLNSRILPPRIITDEMIENIIVKMLQSFEENLAEFSHQAVYIQYLFDVKYLTALLIPVENVSLINQSNNVISQIEGKIDPVDLDTVSPHIVQHVQQYVYQTRSMFGLLISNKPRINVENYENNAEDPNVTYVGTNTVPWFPLLPSAVFSSTRPSEN